MSKPRSRPVHRCQCEICQRHPSSHVARRHKALNRVIADCDEKTRRRLVGLLAQQWGPHCVSRMHRITGLSRNTIQRGRSEVTHPVAELSHRIRRSGAGRLAVEKTTQHLQGIGQTARGHDGGRSHYRFEMDSQNPRGAHRETPTEIPGRTLDGCTTASTQRVCAAWQSQTVESTPRSSTGPTISLRRAPTP